MKKRKRQPTVMQIKALQLMNGGMNKRQAMIKAGYSTAMAEKPYKAFYDQKGIQNQIMAMGQELENAGLNTQYMVGKFKEWLEATRVVSARVVGKSGTELQEADSKTDDFIEVPDYKIQLEGYKEWKKIQDQVANPDVTGKKISSCGGTGSWSLPYKEAGYEVYNITLPEYDVCNYKLPDLPIYGILAAPPCTQFSFARTNAKTPRDLKGGMTIVANCLDLIWQAQYRIKSDQQKYPPLKFWALENPYYGMLRWFLGKPAFEFNPYDFGHNYQKRTAIWGHFNEPIKNSVKLTKEQKEKAKTNSQDLPKLDYMKSKDIAPEWFGKLSCQARRAITPRGFAEAFFKANQ